MSKTKCLDTLGWFKDRAKSDGWLLVYDGNLDRDVFGIILHNKDIDGYEFVPVLHNAQYVHGVKQKFTGEVHYE